MYDFPVALIFFPPVFILGAVFGSFINCAAWRKAKGDSALRGRSRCPVCGNTLRPADLIPLLSFLFLRGHCRFCRTKIPARYILAEFILAAAFVLTAARFGFSYDILQYLFLCGILLYVSLRDIDEYLVPNLPLVSAFAVRVVFALCAPDRAGQLVFLFIGAFSVSLPVLIISLAADKVLKKDSLGGGDIKLLFVTGAYLGWRNSFLAIILACIIGIVYGLAAKKKKQPIPFAPAIASGCFIALMTGTEIIGWYLSLLYY